MCPNKGYFNVRTDAEACDCTRVLCERRKKMCIEMLTVGDNFLAAQGTGIRVIMAPGFSVQRPLYCFN